MSGITKLDMKRLDSLFQTSELSLYNHWVIDVQGAELLVLEGAGELLKGCSSIFIEVSSRNVYENGVQWDAIKEFLNSHNFIELWKPNEKSHENVIFVRDLK